MSGVSSAERQALVTSLETGLAQLEALVLPLSATQWAWAPNAATWSVACCCEHINLTESIILERLATAGTEGLEATAGKDDFVTRAVTSRSRKVPAPDGMAPTRVFATPADFLSAFHATRKRAIDRANDMSVDLRSICAPHFALKELDGYQWLLMTAAHLRRHVLQIEELMGHADFPR